MASTTQAVPNTVSTADSASQRGSGRGRGRGGNRRGGRGRGGRGNRSSGSGPDTRNLDGSSEAPLPSVPPPPFANSGTFGGRLTEDANTTTGDEKVATGEGEDAGVEAEVCFICASEVVHNAVAPCNHRSCHICALRMRALYKTKACAHCRTNWDFVIFSDDGNKRFQDFGEADFSNTDNNLGIKYENKEIFEDTILLLRYNCPDPSCDVACLSWPDLHRHVRSVHHKRMCDLCTRNKKVFTHEHELFTDAELRKHERFGDDHPGAIDQSGFRGHPECGFCRQRFYGDDELYAHCRDKHERCHICDRRNEGSQHQYYVDYNSLEDHFRKDHFLCPDQECLEKKFVVFDAEMDLKAHQLETHSHGLSKDARRDARRVDLSGFEPRAQYEGDRRGGRGGRGGREGRGRGRGRDPNAEPLPASSAQPMRRDEIAYQRQMAIQSAQSVTQRSFGGQLTPSGAVTAQPPPRGQEPATVAAAPRLTPRAPEAFPALSSLNLNGNQQQEQPQARPLPSQEANITPQERARRARHEAVIERAAKLLRNDQAKLTQFRNLISSFKNSAITPADLVKSFISLFDTSSAELGKLMRELADIFEIATKRDNLMKAWNDWKAINEDYPSLPGLSGVMGNTAASALASGSGGSRVLNLKKSTAQSSRSAVSRQGSWNSASSSVFPPLAANAPPSTNRPGPGKVTTTPWVSSASSSARPSPPPSRAPSTAPLKKAVPPSSREAFPALPAAAKPTSSVFSPGYGGLAVRRDNSGRGTPVNAWGISSASNGANTPAEEEGEPEAALGKKKGKQNKKQTLIKFG